MFHLIVAYPWRKELKSFENKRKKENHLPQMGMFLNFWDQDSNVLEVTFPWPLLQINQYAYSPPLLWFKKSANTEDAETDHFSCKSLVAEDGLREALSYGQRNLGQHRRTEETRGRLWQQRRRQWQVERSSLGAGRRVGEGGAESIDLCFADRVLEERHDCTSRNNSVQAQSRNKCAQDPG